MIPIKLQLKNFMCYRDNVPPLSFDGIHIACLCGDNGNGKSAILDAITWALWGKSRAKSDDDLVHQGQSEMEVQLEFATQEQLYRVIRKRAKKPSPSRAGQSVLELQVAGDDDFRAITPNSIWETQQKIVDLLHLDYETFKNSAFLRQGHANEFSTKHPWERKEILANILDLSRYDELANRSKALADEKKDKAERLDSAIEETQRQLARKPEYDNATKKIQFEIREVEERIKIEEATVSALRQQRETLEVKREQLSNIETRLKQTRQEFERWQARRKEHQSRIAEYEQVLAKSEPIQKGYSDLVELKGLDNEFNQKLTQLLAVKERANNLDKIIGQAAQELIIEQKKVQVKVAEREAKFARVPQLEEALAQAHNQLDELTGLEKEIAEKRKQVQWIASRISHVESTNTRLEGEITDLREKLRLLAQGDVRCPLCETELGVDERQRIQAKLTSEADGKVQNHRSNNDELNKRNLELRALEKELSEREAVVSKERASRQSRLSITERELAENKQAGKELAQERARLEDIEQRLSKKDYAVQEQQILYEVMKEEKELSYNKERHEYIKDHLSRLQVYESRKRHLDEAAKSIDSEKASLAECEQTISNLNAIMQADLKKRDALKTETSVLPEVNSKLAIGEENYQTLLGNERQVRDRLAVLQERLRHLAELERSKQEKKELWHQFMEEEKIYKELTEAFGKKGIQALLIEQALPEIEIEANRLLGKLTDNRMSLTLESQRETKKGITTETLDIKIADELGTRNYEMYSGGEAFRIDLALRIALSRLLVKRAGASLPILIIDEGFGSQDSSGREKLTESINSIQDDFEKIIVITHLEELKDSFPVLINITKTADGSIISLS